MKLVPGYKHRIAAHCESGTMKNLMSYIGVPVSEQLVFGIGSGIFFAYLPFIKTVSAFPVVALRQPIGTIVKVVAKECGIGLFYREFGTTREAIERANAMLDSGRPVAVSVDLFYMKYLPGFMQVHAPAHFIVLIGREGGSYAVSDAYVQEVVTLDVKDLELALSTHARLAPNNLLYYLESAPAEIDWKRPIVRAIKRTVNRMLMLPVVRNILSFLGVEGINRFARAITRWPGEFKGFRLREGLLFLAVTFEEQGTGGGAFRMMYGAFLQEAADRFGSKELGELAARMVENGKEWREASRALVKIGKKLPVADEEYPDWMAANGKLLGECLDEISRRYRERAVVERRLLGDLRKAVSRI